MNNCMQCHYFKNWASGKPMQQSVAKPIGECVGCQYFGLIPQDSRTTPHGRTTFRTMQHVLRKL